MKRFLGTVPLSEGEMRTRRRTIRVVVYGAGAVLILFTLIFPRQWWAVAGLWFVVSMGFTTWFIILRQRVAAQDRAADSAHHRPDPVPLMAKRLYRIGILELVSGAAFVCAGLFGRAETRWWVVVVGAALLVAGMGLVVWARTLRGPSAT